MSRFVRRSQSWWVLHFIIFKFVGLCIDENGCNFPANVIGAHFPMKVDAHERDDYNESALPSRTWKSRPASIQHVSSQRVIGVFHTPVLNCMHIRTFIEWIILFIIYLSFVLFRLVIKGCSRSHRLKGRRAHMIFEWAGNDLQKGPQGGPLPKPPQGHTRQDSL